MRRTAGVDLLTGEAPGLGPEFLRRATAHHDPKPAAINPFQVPHIRMMSSSDGVQQSN